MTRSEARSDEALLSMTEWTRWHARMAVLRMERRAARAPVVPTAAELLRATLLGALASLRGDIALRARRASALAERTMQWAESADARTSSRARTRSAQASPTRRLPSRGGAAARSQLVARIAQWIVDCALLRPLRRTAVLLCVALAQLQRTQCGAARATRTHSIVVREKLALVLPVLVAWTSAAVRDAPGDRPGDGVRLACRWASLASRRVSVELHRTRIGHRDAVLSEWRVPRGDTADSRAAHDAALLSALVGAARSGTLSALHRTCAVRAEHRLAVWRAWAPRLRRVVERACSWIDGAVARSAGTAARTSAPGLRPSAGDAAGLVRVELVPGDEMLVELLHGLFIEAWPEAYDNAGGGGGDTRSTTVASSAEFGSYSRFAATVLRASPSRFLALFDRTVDVRRPLARAVHQLWPAALRHAAEALCMRACVTGAQEPVRDEADALRMLASEFERVLGATLADTLDGLDPRRHSMRRFVLGHYRRLTQAQWHASPEPGEAGDEHDGSISSSAGDAVPS